MSLLYVACICTVQLNQCKTTKREQLCRFVHNKQCNNEGAAMRCCTTLLILKNQHIFLSLRRFLVVLSHSAEHSSLCYQTVEQATELTDNLNLNLYWANASMRFEISKLCSTQTCLFLLRLFTFCHAPHRDSPVLQTPSRIR